MRVVNFLGLERFLGEFGIRDVEYARVFSVAKNVKKIFFLQCEKLNKEVQYQIEKEWVSCLMDYIDKTK